MTNYFKCLIREVQANAQAFRHYYNDIPNQVQQSSVGIIFKVMASPSDFEAYRQDIEAKYVSDLQIADYSCMTPRELWEKCLQNIDDRKIKLLLTVRANSERDSNSGYTVFPGGKNEDQESDLAACLRQVYEEVGLRLMQKPRGNQTGYLSLYLGKYNNNLYYRKSKNNRVYVSCNIFLVLCDNPTLILNRDEVVSAHWASFQQMVDPENVGLLLRNSEKIVNNVIPKSLKFMENSIKRNIRSVNVTALNIDRFDGMQVWGLTLHLWLHACKIIRHRLAQENQSFQKFKYFIEKCEKFQVRFNWYFLPGIAFRKSIEHWHYKNRVCATRYPPQPYSYRGVVATLLVVFTTIAVCWAYLC